MKRRAFFIAGAALIGAGTLHHSGAFSSAIASRDLSVSVADDQTEALLGIDKINDSTVRFINNFDGEMSVEITSGTVEFDPSSFDFEPDTGSEQEVDVQGEGTATIEASLGADGNVGTITLDKRFENPILREVDGSAVGGGTNGRYEFRLENGGDVNVEITGLRVISVETEDSSANEVANGLEINGTELIDELGVGVDTNIVNFDESVFIGSGTESGVFRFNQIRTPDEPGNMDTTGATVEIEIRYIDSGDDDGDPFTTEITLIDN